MIYVKGTTSVLLNECTKMRTFDNKIIDINEALKLKIKNAIIDMSKN